MKVKDIMSPNPLVIPGNKPLQEIEEIFRNTKYWSIFVGSPGHFEGVITRQDLEQRGQNKSKLTPASAIMSKGVFSVNEDADVEEAIRLISLNHVNGLAVTRSGKHCGIITRYDINQKYRNITKSYPAKSVGSSKLKSSFIIVLVLIGALVGCWILFGGGIPQQGTLGKLSTDPAPTVPTVSGNFKQNAIVTSNYQYTIAPTTGLSVRETDIERAVFADTNQERGRNGLSALTWDDALAKIARDHSKDMAANDFFSHENPAGEDPTARAIRHGYTTRKDLGGGWYSDGIAENIGKMPTGNVIGQGYVSNDAQSVAKAQVDSWMDSPGHRSNILNSGYTRLGVGVAYDGTYYYITQDFF